MAAAVAAAATAVVVAVAEEEETVVAVVGQPQGAYQRRNLGGGPLLGGLGRRER